MQMQIYKARKSKQSLGAAVLSKTSSSSVTGGGTQESMLNGQSHVDGEVDCSTDAVQQQ